MKGSLKIGLVIGGYVAAALVASSVVAVHVAATSGLDRQGAGGMYGCGDTLFFAAVFGVGSVPPTGAALFFLRPYAWIWRTFSIVAATIAVTGVAAFANYVAARWWVAAGSLIQSWSAFAVLRILISPLFVIAFLLAGLFAPNPSARITLLSVTAIEGAMFAAAVATLLLSR